MINILFNIRKNNTFFCLFTCLILSSYLFLNKIKMYID
jgi:V8-like Glu-specific endopeptidase